MGTSHGPVAVSKTFLQGRILPRRWSYKLQALMPQLEKPIQDPVESQGRSFPVDIPQALEPLMPQLKRSPHDAHMTQ